MIAVRVLLPVDEMIIGFNDQRVGFDRRARMRRRTHAQRMRTECDRPLVAVTSVVTNSNTNSHVSELRRRLTVIGSADKLNPQKRRAIV